MLYVYKMSVYISVDSTPIIKKNTNLTTEINSEIRSVYIVSIKFNL